MTRSYYNVRDALGRFTKRAVENIEYEIVHNDAVPDDTVDSISVGSMDGSDEEGYAEQYVSVGDDDHPAARYEYGGWAEPYDIFPKTKKALAFDWLNKEIEPIDPDFDSAGKYIMNQGSHFLMRWVTHPGHQYDPTPFIKPAIDKTFAEFENELGQKFLDDIIPPSWLSDETIE